MAMRGLAGAGMALNRCLPQVASTLDRLLHLQQICSGVSTQGCIALHSRRLRGSPISLDPDGHIYSSNVAILASM